MTSAIRLRIALVTATVALSCDLGGSTVTPSAVGQAVAQCPDVSSIEAVAKADFASEFGLEAQAAAQIQAGVQAALALDGFAAKLDAKLTTACGNLARDFGAQGDFANGQQACKAAIEAMQKARAQLGGSVQIALSFEPPRCAATMDAMADCLAECDAELEPGQVDVQCEKGKLAGQCEAQCTGTCEVDAGAKCNGTCHGECSAKFQGTCGGECSGTCDGKKVNGAQCNGTCKGTCSAGAEGTCGGNCTGSCDIQGSAECNGTCYGECSVEMKAPRCTGDVKAPKASAECNARCDASLSAEVTCTKPELAVVIKGAANAEAAADYAAKLRKNLPAVLEIAVGMKDQALEAAGNVKAVVNGVQAAIGSVKASPEVGARLTACVAAPFKAAIDAAASVQANIDVSVEVKASASASASGSASGSAGAGGGAP